jgi:NADH:ubiquinone oxidoreductase subunit 6 (subunit J)
MTDCGDTDCGADDACFGTVEAVGAQLLGPYVLPFEVSSVLLLAGIVGAVLLTGRRPKESDAAPSVKEPA